MKGKIFLAFLLFISLLFAASSGKVKVKIVDMHFSRGTAVMNCDLDKGPFKIFVKVSMENDYDVAIPIYYYIYDMTTGEFVKQPHPFVVDDWDIRKETLEFNFYAGGKGNGTMEVPAFIFEYTDPDGLTHRINITLTLEHWETLHEVAVKQKLSYLNDLLNDLKAKGCNVSSILSQLPEIYEDIRVCEIPSATKKVVALISQAEELNASCSPPSPPEEEEEEVINITPVNEKEEEEANITSPPVQKEESYSEKPAEAEEKQEQPSLCPLGLVFLLPFFARKWD